MKDKPSPRIPEQETRRSISFIGPSYLDEGQNFFHQPPFMRVIHAAAAFNSVDPSAVQRILLAETRFNHYPMHSRPLHVAFSNSFSISADDPKRNDILKERAKELSKSFGQNYDNLTVDKTYLILQGLIAGLQQFPQAVEYIKTKYDHGFYTSDGEFNRNSKFKYVPTIGYGKWLTDQLALSKHLQLVGIEEVLPKGFTDNTAIEGIKMGGHGREWKRWKILDAADITRDK